jgi:WD40 repeat protein
VSDISDSSHGTGRCRTCGAALNGSRFDGLCPACTWRGLWEAEPEESLGTSGGSGEAEGEHQPFTAGGLPRKRGAAESLFKLPGHVVIEELARGGMGIVYRARQLRPEREVALKMLLPHQSGSPELAERFRLEVRALTGLDHPAILPVYQTGEQDGLPFFTMKLARGGTLAQRRGSYAGDWRGIAQLMATLAEAVQFAHEHGVLHRDLKPGNILFDESDRPYVSDFGLAKLDNSDSQMTRSQDFLGTPHYVAPEVAARSARHATTASDVYSLGAILYELLCGRPPFEAEGVAALLKKIAEEEPAIKSALLTPHSALHQVPRDLEVICLKCLAKEPAARYASARELAADLRRWLDGIPIQAQPISLLERAGRWARRNPMIAGLSAALALALAIGGFMLWKAERTERAALRTTLQAEDRAEQNLREALLAQAKSIGAAGATGQRWQALAALERAARIRPSLELRNEAAAALARPDLREIARFPAFFGNAGSSAVFTSNLDSYITPEPKGGFSLRDARDQSILEGFPGTLGKPARWFVLSPDERQVGALLNDYSLEVWELGAPSPKLHLEGNVDKAASIAFHPNGLGLAGSVPGQDFFLQAGPDGERRFLETKNGRVLYARFDASGERLAAVRDPGGVEMWSLTNGPVLLWFQPMRPTVPWLAWSPDGRKLAAAANDNRGVRLLSALNGQTELVYSRHLLYPRQFEFDPTGRVVASVGQDWVLRLWDSRTGQDLVSNVGRHRVMRFSSDGRRLCTAPSDHELAILERAPDQVFREFTSSNSDFVPGRLCRSPDNRFLLVSYPQIRLYDTVAGAEIGILQELPLFLNKRAFFKPDGSGILYSLQDRGIYSRSFRCHTNQVHGTISIDLQPEELVTRHEHGLIWAVVQSGDSWLRYAPDGLELWPNHDPHQARRAPARVSFDALAVSQNGRWAAAPVSGHVTIWNFDTGQMLTNLTAHNPDRLWFSPDSRWLVVSVEGGYTSWETESWKPGANWEARLDSGDPGEVSFSDDSRFIAARQERQTFRLLAFPECRELVTLKPPLVVPVSNCCLSGDATRLWLLASGYRVFEWNLGELRQELRKLGLDWQDGAGSARAENR